jgi:hypothetical protein
MLKGIYLTLMIGPAAPIVAPQVVIDALTSIQVTNSKDRNGFQIVLSIDKNSSILTTMLPAGYFDPIITRVMIIATLNGFPNVLMDGFVTNHELSPSNEAGKSTLTITGEDVSLAMDLVQIIIPFPQMPDVAKIYFLLAPFAALGVVPVVIPPIIDIPKTITSGWETGIKQTHREYIQTLANACGYTFFIQSGPTPGMNIGYFGPDLNLPIPQPALTINMDAHSNVESLSFSLNGLAKKIRVFTIFDPFTHKIPIPIPLPNVNIFKPPLGIRPIPPAKLDFAEDGAKLEPAVAAKKILGYLMNNPTMVTANGSLDVLRYNGILRPRMLVGVRGAGIAYDGMYYVDSVTHNIKPGEYKQSFTLSRDGLISNTPRVLV